MNRTHSQPCVVVGIDGSESAVHAAEWAADEAAGRDLPLRLIHVIQSTSADIRQETDDAEAALQAAHAAVTRTGQTVKFETAIVRGPVAATLVAESVDAELVCVGSEGLGFRLPKLRGAIAAAVAQSARCTVAVIRTREDTPRSESDDIAAILDHPSDLGTVLPAALDEARLRNATLLVLKVAGPRINEVPPQEIDRGLTDCLSRYPDVQTHTLTVPGDVLTFLAERDPPVQLTVMGNAEGAEATRMVSPYGRFALRDAQCSVLLVRP
jgi:nucleotide-binding universal stress UspA family protein